jgi:serine phosphatase RsbU (regulator of sigma subunit)
MVDTAVPEREADPVDITDLVTDFEPSHVAHKRRPRHHRALIVVVLSLGVVITAALSWTSWSLYNTSENRLLELRVRDAGSLLNAAVPTIQTPLVSAVEIANATNGNPNKFKSFMTPEVTNGTPFVSASLWNVSGTSPVPVVFVGAVPNLLGMPKEAARLFAAAKPDPVLNVTGFLNGPQPRIGYFVEKTGGATRFAVYAEGSLPPNRHLQIAENSAFADLNYALYLGGGERPGDLLATSLAQLPVTGRRAAISVPFGTTVLDFVVTPRGPLSSSFFADLWWITLLLGMAVTFGATFVTRRLLLGREEAEHLAVELDLAAQRNRQLYAEQHSIAATLQNALLPVDLPIVPGIDSAARYVPGVAGVDIGGDWYDLIRLDDERLLLVVGDVSGRGLRAATIMASLRYSIRAYAAESYPPGRILAMLNQILSIRSDGHFATVLCALVDVEAHSLTVANAGHLSPVILDGKHGEVVRTSVGTPTGIARDAAYDELTVVVPTGATLLAFTDGLIERRGEALDIGFARLIDSATSTRGSLDGLLSELLATLAPSGVDDDIAIVGLRWTD